jgi:hypothetical protein
VPLTTAFRHQLINHFLREQTQLSTQGYLTLSSTTPSIDGTGVTEVSGITRQAIGFSAPSSGATTNAADITFSNTSGGSWSIVAICVYNASSGGTLLSYASGLSFTVPNNDIFRVFATDLTYSFS